MVKLKQLKKITNNSTLNDITNAKVDYVPKQKSQNHCLLKENNFSTQRK
jgi:hypothetical protein